MSVSVPATRPKISREEVEKIISHYEVDREKYKVIIVGIRGYYLNTIGKNGVNDRGVYDDAIFIVTPGYFAAYNANCDPSSYRIGYGIGEQKGIANLKPGAYYAWKIDMHRGKYVALCQRVGPMTVIRDGNPPYEQTSRYLGINCHMGGQHNTGSLGCQTIPPNQWDDFINSTIYELKAYYGTLYQNTTVPYCLIEETERRKL